LLVRHPTSQVFQHVINSDSQPANTRLAAAFAGLHSDNARVIHKLHSREKPLPRQTEMQLPFRLRPLNDETKGFWVVTVRANWRVIFRFAEGEAFDIDYLDFH
jgi:hypothetical protein